MPGWLGAAERIVGNMIRFAVIGYGWRADFFYRIAKAMPELFEICAGVLRTEERAEEMRKREGVFTTADLNRALETKPDLVVLCVPKAVTAGYLKALLERRVPVLCETPPGKPEELQEVWETARALGGRVQVLEQYFLQPLYASVLNILELGVLGNVSNMTLSALHGYHAVSIFRKVLRTGFENCVIAGHRFGFDVTATNSRAGLDHSGRLIQANRDMAYLEFESGRTAFMDFSGEQYFSTIRTRRLNIQGERGEINDMTVRYLGRDQEAVTMILERIDQGVYNNSGWRHHGIRFGEEYVYKNPFPGRLNDDEIAVADCLAHMKQYVDTGEEFYPLAQALQDAYLASLMEEAVTTGRKVYSKTQPWA